MKVTHSLQSPVMAFVNGRAFALKGKKGAVGRALVEGRRKRKLITKTFMFSRPLNVKVFAKVDNFFVTRKPKLQLQKRERLTLSYLTV